MNTADKKRHVLRIIEGLAEIVLLALFYYAMWQYYIPFMGDSMFIYRGKYVLLGLYIVLTYLVFLNCDSLQIGSLATADAIVSQSISILLVNVITYFQLCLIANAMITPVPMLVLTLVDIVFIALCVAVFTRIYHDNYITRNMIMIYGSEKAMQLAQKFGRKKEKYDITETVSCEVGTEELVKRISGHDAVIINDIPVAIRNEVMKYCYENSIRLYIAPKLSDVILRGSKDINIFDTPLLLVSGSGLMPEQAFVKRTMDLIICIIALIPCAIIIAAVSIAIFIEDRGPVFYKQTRLTLNDKEFQIIKFRSMIVDAEKHTGAVLAEEDDPRITKVGKFLRKHRLDEIPQIINVLSGDMSIVGPRPERPELAEEIIKTMPEFAYRTKVKGGVTGYAQVYGKYNTIPYDKLKYDLMYIENYSLMLDIKIVLMTPQILLRKESTEGVKR